MLSKYYYLNKKLIEKLNKVFLTFYFKTNFMIYLVFTSVKKSISIERQKTRSKGLVHGPGVQKPFGYRTNNK